MAEGQTFDRVGSFQDNFFSIEYFNKSLITAKECHDSSGQQHAHMNLGYAYLGIEDVDKALHHYREALGLAETTSEDLLIAQVSFVVGCIYHLKHDYQSAISFHEKHLHLAQRFEDSKGQCQAYRILSQLYEKTRQYEKGKRYYGLHATLERELDRSGTQMDVGKSGAKNKFNKNVRAESITLTLSESHLPNVTRSHSAIPRSLGNSNRKSKAGFMQNMTKRSTLSLPKQSSPADSEELVDLLDRVQNTRFDDQRCEMRKHSTDKVDPREQRSSTQLEDVLNTIDRLQKFRLDDQRTAFPRSSHHHHSSLNEQFFDQLSKCQDSRLDNQRAMLLPPRPLTAVRPISAVPTSATPTNISFEETTSKTLPDEEFLSLFNRLQARPPYHQRLHSSPLKRTRVNT